MTHLLALLLPILFSQQILVAQQESWGRLSNIERGKKVQLVLLSGKTTEGLFESSNDDGVTITQDKSKTTQVAKSEIAQVTVLKGMSRGRRAMWVGLIAGAAGGGLMAAACLSDSGQRNCDAPPAALAAGGALLIGGVSAGIAAATPQRKEIIYTRRNEGKPSN